MDARPDELTDRIRQKRIAIDNRLELLRVQLRQRDPRARLHQRWPAWAGVLAAGGGAVWFWRRARRRRADRRARRRRAESMGVSGRPWTRKTWDPWKEELWR